MKWVENHDISNSNPNGNKDNVISFHLSKSWWIDLLGTYDRISQGWGVHVTILKTLVT